MTESKQRCFQALLPHQGGMGNICTPAARGDGKDTQQDAQRARSYSSSLFSNLSPHLITLNHLLKNTLFPCWAFISTSAVSWIRGPVQWNSTAFRLLLKMPPLPALPHFPCHYKEIMAFKERESKIKCLPERLQEYFWLAFSCCWFLMPTESDKWNFKIVREQTENLFLASRQKNQTLPYCTVEFYSGWALDTSTEKLNSNNFKKS